MGQQWSFGRKLGAGFAVSVLLTVLVSYVAISSLRTVVAVKDRVLEENARSLVDAQRLETLAESRISAVRGFLIGRESALLDELAAARAESEQVTERLLARGERRTLMQAVQAADTDFRAKQEEVVRLARNNASAEQIQAAFVNDLRESRQRFTGTINALNEAENRALEAAARSAAEQTRSATSLAVVLSVLAVVFGSLLAVLLTRTITRQITAAVGQVQSSSTELQAAANQQAAGLREQATAMTEITTTISELLATSRQIAESAQRVAAMATDTASSARTGDQTVERAHESIGGIQRQVELIVNHMLDLGRKSQQIGTVLDIVSELAEQTNIVAINATIEASGAGEAGRRFSVVADEIRKLADRVTTSTKEIRSLIDEVRSAVNTTVMATETGYKTVDAGTRQFGEVASSLRQISGLVVTTTEAAREIELSTKQQSTAVEQVNVAIASVAQASKETEASASQTLQTASQLNSLSRELMRILQPEAA
jgi:methyl-accepting chemotaxis protein